MRVRNKIIIVLGSILTLSLVLILSMERLQQGWANTDTSTSFFPTILKNDVVADDLDEMNTDTGTGSAAAKANVLFLLDTSNAMVFSSKGKIPNWLETQSQVGNNRGQIVRIIAPMIKELTYGIGARPATHMDGTSGHSRAGRDVDPSNNDPSNPDCYYSPYPGNRPYFLTFQPEQLANSTTLPINWTQQDLMPNDSRLYKTKLVFWRILENQGLMDKLRYALATTHVSLTRSSSKHIFYKRRPQSWETYSAPWDNTQEFPYGRIYAGYTSPPDAAAEDLNLNVVTQWASSTSATNQPIESLPWLTVNRAYLRVPFEENTQMQQFRFKMLIDGIENNRMAATGSLFFLTNPELTTSGQGNLATSIFPATAQDNSITAPTRLRDKYLSSKLVYYSNRSQTVTRKQEDMMDGQHVFSKASGEAAGSVIDFFSPAISGKGYHQTATDRNGYTPLESVAGNFPIRNACESNWLVVFTAGDDANNDYTSDIAVKHLYDYTKTRSVVRIKDPTQPPSLNNIEETRLTHPIRTMVIGFTDPTDTDPKVQALVQKLNRMADYGDDGKLNGSASAYFANDTTGLISALREVLLRITSEVHISSTPVMVSPKLEEGSGEPDAYASGYKRQSNDQWQGYFERYKVTANEKGDVTLTLDWELGKLFKNYASINVQRRLYTWDWNNASGTMASAIPYPSLTPTPNTLAPLMGLSTRDLALYQPGTPHPSNLMLRWMFGRDYSYETRWDPVRPTLFPDMGNAGYSLVGPVQENSAIAGQPGYAVWAQSTQKRKPTLFLHTNEGLLHAIDVGANPSSGYWGRERWAFIPPNILGYQRLAGLKFNFSMQPDGRKAQWINGSISNAAYMTDGAVRTFNLPFTSNGSKWGTLLIGSMGRGGSGLYAMDVTAPDSTPLFLWAVENDMYNIDINYNNIYGTVNQWNGTGTTKHLQKAYQGYGLGGQYDVHYRQLGFNVPPPAVSTTLLGGKPTNVGVLAAGMQYNMNLAQNGVIGAAIYIFDPMTGRLLRSFSSHRDSPIRLNSGSTQLPHPNPKMGMMLTPPVLITQNNPLGYVTGFFTADNRGQIFEGSFIDTFGTFAISPTDWTLRRTATIKPDSSQTPTSNFCIPYPLSLLKDSSETLWLFGGTADVLGKRGEESDNILLNGIIKNSAQFLFGFRNPKYSANNSLCLLDPKLVNPLDQEDRTDKIDTSEYEGWTIPLEAAAANIHGREYLSSATVVYGSALYASTFLPGASLSATNCTPQGNSRLYVLNAMTGEGTVKEINRKYLNFDGIKIGGMSVSVINGKARLFLSVAILDDTGFETGVPNSKVTANGDYALVDATLHAPALISIELPAMQPALPSGAERLEYWREMFAK